MECWEVMGMRRWWENEMKCCGGIKINVWRVRYQRKGKTEIHMEMMRKWNGMLWESPPPHSAGGGTAGRIKHGWLWWCVSDDIKDAGGGHGLNEGGRRCWWGSKNEWKGAEDAENYPGSKENELMRGRIMRRNEKGEGWYSKIWILRLWWRVSDDIKSAGGGPGLNEGGRGCWWGPKNEWRGAEDAKHYPVIEVGGAVGGKYKRRKSQQLREERYILDIFQD